jgi:hypothetical protein
MNSRVKSTASIPVDRPRYRARRGVKLLSGSGYLPDLLTDFPSVKSPKTLATTGLDSNFGFHAGGYIVTCSSSSICSCSGVGVLF